jgi:integrase/recombinase XerD
MNKKGALGPWIRRFLLEYLVRERNMSTNTQQSYRDTLKLFLPFVSSHLGKRLDLLEIHDLTADIVRLFLTHIEEKRKVSTQTRNQRLAAIHSLAQFIAERNPEDIVWCGQIKSVHFKKTSRPLIPYLEKHELEALLSVPDRSQAVGQRNYLLLLFLYNSGARVSEATELRIADLDLNGGPGGTATVRIKGKGSKTRRCPLWERTATEMRRLIDGRAPAEKVFLNRRGQPLTRYGVYAMIKACVAAASQQMPSLAGKRVSPHTVRHTTATHLLRAGVDINTIRSWLGHVSLDTTLIYAEVDLEMKARALEMCSIGAAKKPAQTERSDLMSFLNAL